MHASYMAIFLMLLNSVLFTQPASANAMNVLKNTLKQKQSWVKVHAAEYLIELGHTDIVRREFLTEEKLHSKEIPYRIGIWRVLARADQSSRQSWIDRILNVYDNSSSPDRLHAVETLAKLDVAADRINMETAAQDLRSADSRMRLYTIWATSNANPEKQQASNDLFIDFALHNSDPVLQKISAYILRFQNNLTLAQWNSLFNGRTGMANRNHLELTLTATLLGTLPASVTDRRVNQLKSQLLEKSDERTVSQRKEICLCLAEKGDKNSISFLNSVLDMKAKTETDATADLQSAAAYAILKIKTRK